MRCSRQSGDRGPTRIGLPENGLSEGGQRDQRAARGACEKQWSLLGGGPRPATNRVGVGVRLYDVTHLPVILFLPSVVVREVLFFYPEPIVKQRDRREAGSDPIDASTKRTQCTQNTCERRWCVCCASTKTQWHAWSSQTTGRLGAKTARRAEETGTPKESAFSVGGCRSCFGLTTTRQQRQE